MAPDCERRAAFQDHFSGHAADYDAYRPSYPPELFAYLGSISPAAGLAWDCATGNGQAAGGLAKEFSHVVATDASLAQIERAVRRPNVNFVLSLAEQTPLAPASVDLATVAQALHWLRPPGYFAEARRVLRTGGVCACWCYELHTIDPAIDAVVHRLYADILGTYWAPERRLVETGYATIEFPFEPITPPPFAMRHRWDQNHLLGYLGSWSSAQNYLRQTGSDPLDLVRADLANAWGDPGALRTVVWPLHLRIGRVR